MSNQEFYLVLGISLFVYFLFLCIYWYVKKFPPTEIGPYGYKTPRSMKNIANWNYANSLSNKLMYRLANGYIIIMLIVLLGFRPYITNKIFSVIFSVLIVLQVVLMIGITEYKLKQFEKKQS
jgi:hypothetical protein